MRTNNLVLVRLQVLNHGYDYTIQTAKSNRNLVVTLALIHKPLFKRAAQNTNQHKAEANHNDTTTNEILRCYVRVLT